MSNCYRNRLLLRLLLRLPKEEEHREEDLQREELQLLEEPQHREEHPLQLEVLPPVHHVEHHAELLQWA